MQNVQNATEIQQRVMNLVDLYRRKVSKESKAAKELADYYKTEYDNEIDFAYRLHEQGIDGYCLNIEIPEDAVDAIRANEQLLGYFYKEVAGDDADPDVLSNFLAEKYDSTIFSEEETTFLKSHFAEIVNYIILTPNNNLQAVEEDDRNDIDLLPQEVLDLVKERVAIPAGSRVYNPFTGFAQLAYLYKDSSFFCEESYMYYFKRWNVFCDKLRETGQVENKVDENKLHAWMRVVLYANKINATVIEDGSTPQNCNAVVSYIPFIPSAIPNKVQGRMGDELSDPDMINKLLFAYKVLTNGGKMVLIIPTRFLWEKVLFASGERTSYSLELEALWKQLIEDNSLVEIIQLPSVMGKSIYDEEHCIVIAEKGCKGKDVTFIDARYASQNSDGILFKKTLDLDALHTMIENGGKEDNTGLRKFVQIPRNEINSDLLVPQVYVLEKPSESDAPVPLTELCALGTAHIYDVQENLPEDTPWITQDNLTPTFQGTLDMSTPKKAGCPNNPEGWKYGNRKLSNFLMGKNGYPENDIYISRYRNCKYVDGKKDAVLFKLSEEDISTSVINATGNAIAVSPDIHILQPNNKIDALSLAAILQMPVVYRQIKAYEKFGLYGPLGHLKDIIVPTEKRILHDEILRLNNEYATYVKQEGLLATKKTEYINEVRMRKHDMGQYIFELVNIEDLMRYYLDNRETEKDFCQQIKNLLDNFRSSLGDLSTLLDNLSKEEQFGNPETFNVNEFLSGLGKRHIKDSYRIQYTCDWSSIKKYNEKKQQAELDAINDQMIEEDMKRQAELDAINDQMLEEDMKQQAELDAIADQMMMEDMKQQAEMDAIADQMMMEDMKQQAESDAINHQMMMEDMKLQAESDAINDQMMKDDMKRQADTETPLTMSFVIGRDNGISANASMYMPPIYVAPNDFQRLVNNILNNAKRHGFTNPNKKDYVVQINASIDAESGMYQIDFRNNGDPLPEGMNKMRYGLKGEKAGKTAGTGLGGNYVKSFVEHYGGDYDIFMEDGWTVVRICLPIK